MKCKHKWKEISRIGRGKDLAIKQICELCKKEAVLYPNLLGNIFGI
jgi:hypothetical protein